MSNSDYNISYIELGFDIIRKYLNLNEKRWIKKDYNISKGSDRLECAKLDTYSGRLTTIYFNTKAYTNLAYNIYENFELAKVSSNQREILINIKDAINCEDLNAIHKICERGDISIIDTELEDVFIAIIAAITYIRDTITLTLESDKTANLEIETLKLNLEQHYA